MNKKHQHYLIEVHAEDPNCFYIHNVEPNGQSYQHVYNPKTKRAAHCDCLSFAIHVKPARKKATETAKSQKEYLQMMNDVPKCAHEIMVLQYTELKETILEEINAKWSAPYRGWPQSMITTLYNEIIKCHEYLDIQAFPANDYQYIKIYIDLLTKHLKDANKGKLPAHWALSNAKVLKNNGPSIPEKILENIDKVKKDIQRTMNEAISFISMHPETSGKISLDIFITDSTVDDCIKDIVRISITGEAPTQSHFDLYTREACFRLGGKAREVADFW
jgi:hypothetical protein